MAPTLNIFGFVSRFLFSGGWQVCHTLLREVVFFAYSDLTLKFLKSDNNENQSGYTLFTCYLHIQILCSRSSSKVEEKFKTTWTGKTESVANII